MTVPEYDEFYAALWPRLVRTAYAVSGDLGIAEDAVQTAFAKAYRSWRRISRLDSPEAYVRKMAVNEVLSNRRRAALRHEVTRADPPERAARRTPEDTLAHDEMWRALSALPPRQRAVLVLRYYEDLSEQQIADALGCRPGTVKSQASAALATLRTRMGDPAATPAGGEQA
jgi:RNA polymerase sigma-70 factor (sigma-E family)